MVHSLRRTVRGIFYCLVTGFLCGCVYTPFELEAPDIGLSSLFSADPPSEEQVKGDPLDQARPQFFLPAPRVRALPPLELEINAQVQRELDYLDRSGFVSKAIARHPQNARIVREVLNDEGLPADLLALALIESGLNSGAKSKAGAVGLWQLMKSTARLYNLSVNFFNDERRDPVLSSLAAARHLKDLYYLYKDWHLALAAYNAGTGKIDRALMHTGSTTFWQLARTRALRHETVRFVPRVIAAAILMRRYYNSTTPLGSRLSTS